MTIVVVMFHLDARLQADTVPLTSFPLSEVLLMDDAQYPWVILVPRRPGVTELHELNEADRIQLLSESTKVGRTLSQLFPTSKLNVAALGNVVSQLHLHHVVRTPDDPAWPGPVWGRLPRKPYTATARTQLADILRQALASEGKASPYAH